MGADWHTHPAGKHGMNPLAGGFYTVSEAARLIRDGNPSRIRGWLQGYANRAVEPLLRRDYQPIDARQELSFLDLIEIRFVEHFRKYSVKARTLRLAQETLRAELDVPHPFASGKVLLVADRADICRVMRDAAKRNKDAALLSLTTNNFVMGHVIESDLVPGIEFGEDHVETKAWKPREREFPDIIVNPLRMYGQPILPEGQATSSIYAAWKAEAGNSDAVSYWTGLTSLEIDKAVRFEQLLDAPQ